MITSTSERIQIIINNVFNCILAASPEENDTAIPSQHKYRAANSFNWIHTNSLASIGGDIICL